MQDTKTYKNRLISPGCQLMVPSHNPGSFGPQHLNVGPLSIFKWGTVALLPVFSPVPPSVEIRFQHISK